MRTPKKDLAVFVIEMPVNRPFRTVSFKLEWLVVMFVFDRLHFTHVTVATRKKNDLFG